MALSHSLFTQLRFEFVLFKDERLMLTDKAIGYFFSRGLVFSGKCLQISCLKSSASWYLPIENR